MTEKALTLRQAAEVLGISYSTIFGKRKEIAFRLPGSRIWRVWPQTLQDLQKSADHSKVVSLSVRDTETEPCLSTSTQSRESISSTSSLIQKELDALLGPKTK